MVIKNKPILFLNCISFNSSHDSKKPNPTNPNKHLCVTVKSYDLT